MPFLRHSFADPLRTFYGLFLTPFSGICYSVCLSHRRITQPLPKDYPRITRQNVKFRAFTVYILCIYTLFHYLCSFLNTVGAWDFVHCACIECRHSLLHLHRSIRLQHPPCRMCSGSPTPAFLRLLVRGDVFSVETVASAWGSGREGAPAAPVSEENTSAIGFRASKHHNYAKQQKNAKKCTFLLHI